MLIVAILLQVIGVFTTLTTLVFLAAASPNSSPKQLNAISWMMRGIALVGLTGLIGGVIAMVKGHNGTACLFGLLPFIACVGLIAWAFIRGAPKPDPSDKNDGW